MRLSTCGSVVMLQPPDLPDPEAGTPADTGNLLQWERYLDFAQGAPHREPILFGRWARGQGRRERACRRNATARPRSWRSGQIPPVTKGTCLLGIPGRAAGA